MKICIFGAGAIGGYVGLMLKKGGADVSLIARGPHLDAINSNGIKVIFKDEELVEKMPATETPSELGPQDYVIVALKAHQAWQAAEGDHAPAWPGHSGRHHAERHTVVVLSRI